MLLMDNIRLLLDNFLGLIRRYVLELIILMFTALFTFWCFAFFANGLYDCKFDLQSCWGGFSAIGGAGVLAAIKYCTDSWKNSPEGVHPVDTITDKMDTNHDGEVNIQDITAKAEKIIGGK